jgi:toxin FitB
VRILLDTNVISELQRPSASPRVIRRLREFDPSELFISVVTVGEIVKGISSLAAGKKRAAHEAWLAGLEKDFASRFLPIDLETSRIWGEIMAACAAKGKKIPAVDGLIAATATRHGLHLMTRNTKDFLHTGVLLINPWEE